MFQKIKHLCFLLLFVPMWGHGQDFEQDLKAITAQLDSSKFVSIVVKSDVFQKKGGKLIYSTTSSVDYEQKNSLTKLDDMEFVYCDGYEIQIDHSEKMIYIKKSTRGKKQKVDIDLKTFKQYLKAEGVEKDTKVVKLLSDKEGIRTYQITQVEGLDEVLFVIDSKQQKILKVVYQYAEKSEYKGQYIVLTYNKFDIDTKAASKKISLKNYFTKEGSSYKVNSRFKTYKLIAE